jgi:putative NADH-flavin reductase
MKLVVLGATGGTGIEIVKQAIERGHSVTALVRSPDRLKAFRDCIAIRKGDLLNSVDLEQSIQGHDAVLSGFGPRVPISKADAHLLQQFAAVLTGAMLHAEVRRVVVESVAFLFKDSVLPPAYLLGRLLFPRTVADASAMERVFAESELDWTMVRPPELTDKPLHRNVSYALRPPASFWFQNLACGCGRFHDQGSRGPLHHPQNRRSLQLTLPGAGNERSFELPVGLEE